MGESKKVIVYTDGACSGNPGPGGWAALLIINGEEIELTGGEQNTTNQRMEMTAPLEALRTLEKPALVEIYSDSAYLVNAFTRGWIKKWQQNGWTTVKGEPVKNRDLWEGLLEMTRYHRVSWFKVKGHDTDEYNKRCDRLARETIPQ